MTGAIIIVKVTVIGAIMRLSPASIISVADATGEDLAAHASACPVLAEVGTSDHAPVMATFDV